MTVRDVATDVIAVHRLTRLVTEDTLLHEPREAIIRWAYHRAGLEVAEAEVADGQTWADVAVADGPRAPKLAALVTCRWCTSVWVTVGVLAARRAWPRGWRLAAEVLAVADVATLMAGLEAD